MKTIAFLTALLFSSPIFSQVGINTTKPTSTLDVNGTLRVRQMTGVGNLQEHRAIQVVGIDSLGNFVPITIGENVQLIDNTLVAMNRTTAIGSLPAPITGNRVNNLGIGGILFPGEGDRGRGIIRMEFTASNLEITGIEEAPDGTHIWLYAYSGPIRLRPNDSNSATRNQIENNRRLQADQYEMIELMYDAHHGKWIVMSHGDDD